MGQDTVLEVSDWRCGICKNTWKGFYAAAKYSHGWVMFCKTCQKRRCINNEGTKLISSQEPRVETSRFTSKGKGR